MIGKRLNLQYRASSRMLILKRDQSFLRALVVRCKHKDEVQIKFPWRDAAEACRRYHEHDKWAPCNTMAHHRSVNRGKSLINKDFNRFIDEHPRPSR